MLAESQRGVPKQYAIEGEDLDKVRLLMQYGRPYHYRKAKLRTYSVIPYGYPFRVLQEPRLQGMDSVTFFTLMLSRSCDFDIRNMVRKNMKTLWTRFSVHSIFVLGSSDPFCDERIAEENRLFGDILQFDHSDTYNNITLSVLFSLHYIHNLSLPIQYVLKTDSDCVVNYPQLEKLIGALSELEQSQLYMGMCDRDKKYNVYEVARKNYIPLSLVQNETFIPYYVTGGGYVISYRLLPRLLVGMSHLSFIGHNEDVNVGRGMQLMHIPCRHVPKYWIARHGCTQKKECLKHVIIHPWMDVSEVPRYYSYLTESPVCNKHVIHHTEILPVRLPMNPLLFTHSPPIAMRAPETDSSSRSTDVSPAACAPGAAAWWSRATRGVPAWAGRPTAG